ncbi:lipoprotein [Spiroplasma cantharicola]|uniref:Lipoprotein n=1 Tax=Spiroplasma cantharicola TaxID=362837 RepID=A0A0M4KC33_9MOLU|nr:lipoprotein [Spiroplasma cantharicola]ALD66190.1 hypothetical protein SCANT_v1c02800 [Spiroplasma cantharicola]
MRRILSLLSSISLIASSSTLVASCTENSKEFKTIDFEKPSETIKEFESIKLKLKNRSKINGLKIESSSNLKVQLSGKNNDELIIIAGAIKKENDQETNEKEWVKMSAKNAYTEVIEFKITANLEGYKAIEVSGLNNENNLHLKAGLKETIVILNYEQLINFKINSDSTESINYMQNGDNIIVNAKQNSQSGASLKLILSADNSKVALEINIEVI